MQIKVPVIQVLLGFFSLVLVSPSLPARSLSDPGDYEQCVLESMKGVTSQRAADTAMGSCCEKFKEVELLDVDLPPDAVGKLVVQAGFGYGIFSGNVYNGNNDYTITRITVLLSPMEKKKSGEAFAHGKEYNIDLAVPPFTKGALSIPILSDNTLEYLWEVTKARGYKTR